MARKPKAEPTPPPPASPFPITVADLQSVQQVIAAVAESSDQMNPEQAIAYREQLDLIIKSARTAMAMIDTQTIKMLDGQPVKIGGAIYTSKETGKWRPDHGRIRERVVTLAVVDPVSGEKLEAEAAAGRAVDLTYKLFVSPSQQPKREGLDATKLSMPQACDWEVTGKELVKVVVDGGPE